MSPRLPKKIFPQLDRLDDLQRSLDPPAGFARRDDVSLSLFAGEQLLQIMTRTVDRLYPELDAREHIPVSTDIAPGAKSHGYDSFEQRGTAQWLGGGATNVASVGVGKKRHLFPVEPFGTKYGHNVFDMLHAMYARIALEDKLAAAARRACAEFEHTKLLLGELSLGIPGFLNNVAVPIVAVPNGNWRSAGITAAQMVQDVNFVIRRPWLGTKKVHKVSTVAVPNEHFELLSTTQMPNLNLTVLNYLKSAHPAVEFRALTELETAGTGDTPRMVAYQKDPEMLNGVVPIPFTQLDPQLNGFETEVFCFQSTGGTVFYYPLSAVYGEGI